jgi:hypothetical protein
MTGGVLCGKTAADAPEVPRAARRDDRTPRGTAPARLAHAERLAARASLSADEARDARQEIETTRQGIEQMDAMLTLRRQDLRPM